MLWHNSFAGRNPRGRGGLCKRGTRACRAPKLFLTGSALPPPKLNVELTSTRHSGRGALGCAVTNRFDEVDATPDQKPGRGPLFHVVATVMLVCLGSGSALVSRAYGLAPPSLSSFSSMTSTSASSARPTASVDKPVGLSDLTGLQQQIAGSVQSTERLLAAQQAQQAEIKRLSDQVAALSGKLELLQRPMAAAQAAIPAPAPKPVAAAKPKKPAPILSTGSISTGGAPLPLTR